MGKAVGLGSGQRGRLGIVLGRLSVPAGGVQTSPRPRFSGRRCRRRRFADKVHDMPSRNVTVYLADDSEPIRARVTALLGACAMNVVGQGDTPQACIAGILATRPDVVVLDVQLEGGQGLEVLRAVRPVAPRIAFVVFSNNSGPAYRKRYLAAGAVGFLDKTAEFDQLAQAVSNAPQLTSH